MDDREIRIGFDLDNGIVKNLKCEVVNNNKLLVNHATVDGQSFSKDRCDTCGTALKEHCDSCDGSSWWTPRRF